MQTATACTIDTARAAYIARFDTLAAAAEFETHVLGIGREFLPECALAVLDDRDAATVEYYEWLLEQAHEAHDAADGDPEDDQLLAAVESAYEAAAGTWTGREWHDGDKVTPESTDEEIAEMLTRGDRIGVTCWGVDESDASYLRRVWAATAELEAAWARGDAGEADFSAVCNALRELAAESDAGVARQAALAEQAARVAMDAVRAGERSNALHLADEAARIERQYGDAPTWGPFADVVRAWSEHE